MRGWVLSSILAGRIFCPGKKGNVCAPLSLPLEGEKGPRRGGKRGRLRPSRAPGAPGISLSHRTYNVLQEQLDRLFRWAECASQKSRMDLRSALKCLADPNRNTRFRDLQRPLCVKGPLERAQVLLSESAWHSRQCANVPFCLGQKNPACQDRRAARRHIITSPSRWGRPGYTGWNPSAAAAARSGPGRRTPPPG